MAYHTYKDYWQCTKCGAIVPVCYEEGDLQWLDNVIKDIFGKPRDNPSRDAAKRTLREGPCPRGGHHMWEKLTN